MFWDNEPGAQFNTFSLCIVCTVLLENENLLNLVWLFSNPLVPAVYSVCALHNGCLKPCVICMW